MLIGLDVDGVICNFVKSFIDIHNDYLSSVDGFIKFTDNEYIKETNIIDKFENIIGRELFLVVVDIMQQQKSALNFELYAEAKEFYKELCKDNEVVIVTSPLKAYKNWMPERLEWLNKHFSIHPDQVCFMANKKYFSGDVLIDDTPKVINDFLSCNNSIDRQGILLTRPWNINFQNTENITRANNYSSILTTIRSYA